MTEKRFTVQRIYKGMDDGVKYYDWCVMKNDEIILRLTTRMDCKDVVEVLNELSEENEKLKQLYTKLKHRHSLLHDVCIEAECDRDSYCKDVLSLEKENEQLQKDCTALIYHNQEYRKENEQLKSEIKGMRELLKSYRKTIKHDAELLADATKNGYLPPLGEWKEVEK